MSGDKTIIIRSAEKTDIPALAYLSRELGYPTTDEEEMHERYAKLSLDPNNGIFVAVIENVIGWIHISITQSIQSDSFAEIRGLIVDQSHRNSGVATKLVLEAEDWVKKQGYNNVRVRTNETRDQAISFYNKLGYAMSKTQKVFDKAI